MTAAIRSLVVLLCVLAFTTPVSGQQQRTRLLVTNNTETTVELFAWVKNTWQSRGRISRGSSMPVYNVANGQRFRAVWGSRSSVLIIKLTYDPNYGGWQQRWRLPE